MKNDIANEPSNQNKGHFTGFFSGEAPVIAYLPHITVLFLNELLKPVTNLYNKMEDVYSGLTGPPIPVTLDQ